MAEDLINCPHCGSFNLKTTVTCWNCKKPLPTGEGLVSRGEEVVVPQPPTEFVLPKVATPVLGAKPVKGPSNGRATLAVTSFVAGALFLAADTYLLFVGRNGLLFWEFLGLFVAAGAIGSVLLPRRS